MQDTSKKLLPTLITILRFRSKYLHFPVIRISHSHIVLFLIGSKRNVGSPCFLPIREISCLVNTRFIFFVHPSIVINSFYSFIYLSLSLSLFTSRTIRNEITNVRYETTRLVFTFRPVATSRGFRVNWYNYFIDWGRSAQLLALIFISMRRETCSSETLKREKRTSTES